MASQTLRASGLNETLRALNRADKETRKMVRDELQEGGEIVREEWSLRLDAFNPTSAAGLRTRVRTRGVFVGQSLRKTTGKRPDYGRLQMRIGEDVTEDKEDDVIEGFENALDRIADNFDRR